MGKIIKTAGMFLSVVFLITVNVSGNTIAPAGWPDHVAMGAVVNAGAADIQTDADVDAFFKYATGEGAPGRILFPNNTDVLLAQSKLHSTAKCPYVIPVLVEYTANGSDGKKTLVPDFKLDYMTRHFINLILDSQLINYYITDNGVHTVSIILNPDFLGEIQKEINHNNLGENNAGATLFLGEGNTIEVITALKRAVAFISEKSDWTLKNKTLENATPIDTIKAIKSNYFGPAWELKLWDNPSIFETVANSKYESIISNKASYENIKIPSYITDDFKGYCQAANWIIRNYAPKATFGWMSNIWACSGSGMYDGLWVHRNPTDADISGYAKGISDFWNKELGIYSGENKPDFIVFDKFERNAFDTDGNTFDKGWLWSQDSLNYYLKFVKDISKNLGVPAMIWQIPGGHLAADVVVDDVTDETSKMSTEPQFFLGDENFSTVHVKDRVLTNAYGVHKGKTVIEFLGENNEKIDWSKNNMQTVSDSNIFSILWGGGNTTSIGTYPTSKKDDGWLKKKINIYYQNPVEVSKELK